MAAHDLADYLLFRSWWKYPSPRVSWIDVVYHGFNLFEGSVWIVLSCLVLRRFLRHRRSSIELAYAVAFFTFGLTDFREAYVLETWLIWVKGANLIALLWLRSVVIRRYYPASKLY
jgi:hypothetical protein